MKNNRFKREQPLQVICNEKINYDTVRVNDVDGESRIIDTKTAIRLAKSKELDLILIAENANPPVCKVTSLNKFLYEKKQKEKEQKKKH